MKEAFHPTFIGIDISKLTLDIFVATADGQHLYSQIENSLETINQWLSTIRRNYPDAVVIGMENTGRYNWPLYQALSGFQATVFVLNPLALSKSLGLIRGKNDKTDARRICEFVRTHQKELRPWVRSSEVITELKLLLSERAARVKSITALKAQRTEYKTMPSIRLKGQLDSLAVEQLTGLQAQLKQIECMISQLISEDPCLNVQAELIRSVPGVGKVLCWNMLAKTEGFTVITEPRKMACYCGVAPFDHSSGSSLRRQARVSSYADKGMKKLFHLAATSAARTSEELRVYYQRMVASGKSKMSVINAIRNKIIHRIYAVIRNNEPYKPYNLDFAKS